MFDHIRIAHDAAELGCQAQMHGQPMQVQYSLDLNYYKLNILQLKYQMCHPNLHNLHVTAQRQLTAPDPESVCLFLPFQAVSCLEVQS